MNSSPKRPHVLVVDDQKNWLEALQDLLEPACNVETAASYDEARQLLAQRAYDVVVSDQRLVDTERANMQGIVLLDEVNALQDGTRAIVVTGYPTIEAAKAALRGRNAYDYLLKYPEEGGPFKYREYRDLVKAAAAEAMQLRQKAITVDFSLSSIVANLTYGRLAEVLFPGAAAIHDHENNVKIVFNRLIYPLQPLARELGRSWLSETDHICEVLCWSRGQGQPILVRIAREGRVSDGPPGAWLKADWQLAKNDEFTSDRVAGVAYLIGGLAFDDFEKFVEAE